MKKFWNALRKNGSVQISSILLSDTTVVSQRLQNYYPWGKIVIVPDKNVKLGRYLNWNNVK